MNSHHLLNTHTQRERERERYTEGGSERERESITQPRAGINQTHTERERERDVVLEEPNHRDLPCYEPRVQKSAPYTLIRLPQTLALAIVLRLSLFLHQNAASFQFCLPTHLTRRRRGLECSPVMLATSQTIGLVTLSLSLSLSVTSLTLLHITKARQTNSSTTANFAGSWSAESWRTLVVSRLVVEDEMGPVCL